MSDDTLDEATKNFNAGDIDDYRLEVSSGDLFDILRQSPNRKISPEFMSIYENMPTQFPGLTEILSKIQKEGDGDNV